MNWRGHRAADDLVDELEARCRTGSGSTSMSQTANWPCPPDCLTWRPCPLAGPANVSRSCTRHGHRLDVDAVAVAQPVEQHVERAPRPCTRAPAGGSRGSSPAAGSGPRRRAGRCPGTACPRRPWTWPRSRPAAAGRASPTAPSAAGRSLSESVSPVSARVSLATAQMSPAIACGAMPLGLAERERERADPLVDVVVLVPAVGPRSARRRARSCRGAACRRTRGPARSGRRRGRSSS